MEKVKSFFDDFVFHARVMPVLTAIFPIIVLSVFKGCVTNDFLDASLYLFIFLIFLVFASKLSREFGKRYENKMYQDLGEKPTTIVLRYSDSTIDRITKTRYHKTINEKIVDINLPLNSNEESNDSDVLYASAMTYLRKYANANRDIEPRVYQELKEYNYWRNLYGCKWISIIVYSFMAIREIILNDSFNINNIFLKPYPEYVTFLVMILGIIAMCVFVNKDVVKRKAFDYAKTLAETCERF